MSDKYVLACDPGKSSGIALLAYNETEPVRLVKAWQFGNGVQGLPRLHQPGRFSLRVGQ